MELQQAKAFAHDIMPEMLDWHAQLVSIPSVAFPGYPKEPMEAIVPVLLDMFRACGVPNVSTLEIPGGYPAIFAELPGPEGSPVVTMYAHYDVQPVPPTQKWDTDPWTPTLKEDGRVYGRGAADDKSGVITIAGALKAFEGNPPCTIRLVIEGEEETGSHIEAFVEENPELFASDLFIVADSGSDKVGHPSICTGLRGSCAVTVTVDTLPAALHSGLFGGAAPDAMFCLLTMLSAMYDEVGNTVIPGLHQFHWEGAEVSEEQVLKDSGTLPGVGLMGSGPVQDRLWCKPAVTVIGIDGVPVEKSSNALNPTASARVSLRCAPGADTEKELEILQSFLAEHVPLGATVTFTDGGGGNGFLAAEGPFQKAALVAMEEAYGVPAGTAGSGGGIPLVNVFCATKEGSEAVIWGPQDTEKATIHGPNESVSVKEMEDMIVSTIRLLAKVGR